MRMIPLLLIAESTSTLPGGAVPTGDENLPPFPIILLQNCQSV